jgi:hypothetical protein
VKLNAHHSSICKFGTAQADQDNFKLVRINVQDLYERALEIGMLHIDSSTNNLNKGIEHDNQLKERLVKLRSIS